MPFSGPVLGGLLLLTALSASADDPAARLPGPEDFPGWQLVGEVKNWPASELWQPIDGAADQYLRFGCRSLTVAYYQREGAAELAVELYDMGESLSAFGIYAEQRPDKIQALTIGAQAYYQHPMLFFFADRWYVRIQDNTIRERSAGEAAADRTAMHRLAEEIARRIGRSGSLPAVFSDFPKEGLWPHSFAYLPSGILGAGDLTAGYSARYRFGDQEVTAILFPRDREPTAREILETVHQLLLKRGTRTPEKLSILDATGYSGDLKYRGPVRVLQSGKRVLLLTGAIDASRLQPLVTALLKP